MPAKGSKATDVTRGRIKAAHWTKKEGHERDATIERLREARAQQVHPSLAARNITAEMAAAAERDGLLWCSGGCKAFIPEAEFGHYQKTGKALSWCRKCYRNYMRDQRSKWTPERRSAHARARRCEKYGITTDQFNEMLAAQDGRCAVCGSLPDGSGVGRPHKGKSPAPTLCVDHSHATGRVRGLLCFKCNTSMERLDSVPDWPSLALAYLQKYS